MIKLRVTVILMSLFVLMACHKPVTTWRDNLVGNKEQEGWLLILEQFEGERLAFINTRVTERIDSGVFYVKLAWVDRLSITGGHLEEIFYCVLDCINDRSAFIDESISLNQTNLSNLEWHSIQDDQLHPLLCRHLESHMD